MFLGSFPSWKPRNILDNIAISTGISRYYDDLKDLFQAFLSRLDQVWQKRIQILCFLCVFGFFFFYAFMQSVVVYGLFYNYVLITPAVERFNVPLKFNYSNRSNTPMSSDSLVLTNSLLTPRQLYDVQLPESPTNFRLGMFVIEAVMSICHPDNRCVEIARSSKNSILKYKSKLRLFLETVFFIFPMIFQYTDESQTISTLLFHNFNVDHYLSKGESFIMNLSINKQPQLHEASLSFIATLSGLSYYGYYWFYTTAVIGVSIFFVLTLIGTAIFWIVVFFIFRDRILGRYEPYSNDNTGNVTDKKTYNLE